MRSTLPSLSGKEDKSDEERYTDEPADSDIAPSLLLRGDLKSGTGLSDERSDRSSRSESARAGEQVLNGEKHGGQHRSDAAHQFRADGARIEKLLCLEAQVSW
jgi:hypothetical protein